MKTKTIKIMTIGLLSFFVYRNANSQTTYGSGTMTDNCATLAGHGGTNSSQIGCGAGASNNGAQNTSYGHKAFFSNLDCSENIAVGYEPLYTQNYAPNFPTWNIAVGNQALFTNNPTSNTTGKHNNAFGHAALFSTTTGVQNTATGNAAGYYNQTGNDNAIYGFQSGGYGAGVVRSFSNNSFFGSQAGYNNTTASNNNAFGYKALYSATTAYANVGIASNAAYSTTTGAYNIAIGDSALYTNSTGNFNTAAGYQALYSNTASTNTGFGYQAGFNSTTGIRNTFYGHQSGFHNTTGSYNYYLGSYTGFNNATGSYNIIIGDVAGYGATGNNYSSCVLIGQEAGYHNTGSQNSFIGYQSAYGNLSGNYNTASGYFSLYSNTSGSNNTAFGNQAGFWTTTGDSNTFVGAFAGVANGNGALHNCGAFGYGATPTASQMIRIGNSKVTVIQGQVGFTTSDGRFKTNIQENVKGLEFINKLRPVTYKMDIAKIENFMRPKTDSSGNIIPNNDSYLSGVQSGFIAQEVEQAAIESGFTTNIIHKSANDHDPYAISYEGIVVPLVKAVQELSKTVDSLKSALNHGASNRALQNNNSNGLNGENITMSAINVELSNVNVVVLNQNQPNPFAEQTIITYNIPNTAIQSQILFYDNDGKLIKTVDIKTAGKGQLNVFANDLTSGIYSYTLLIDGKIYDTKKMVKQ